MVKTLIAAATGGMAGYATGRAIDGLAPGRIGELLTVAGMTVVVAGVYAVIQHLCHSEALVDLRTGLFGSRASGEVPA